MIDARPPRVDLPMTAATFPVPCPVSITDARTRHPPVASAHRVSPPPTLAPTASDPWRPQVVLAPVERVGGERVGGIGSRQARVGVQVFKVAAVGAHLFAHRVYVGLHLFAGDQGPATVEHRRVPGEQRVGDVECLGGERATATRRRDAVRERAFHLGSIAGNRPRLWNGGGDARAQRYGKEESDQRLDRDAHVMR
eukprot:ctg_698.g353